jgi:hypothetical protein
VMANIIRSVTVLPMLVPCSVAKAGRSDG